MQNFLFEINNHMYKYIVYDGISSNLYVNKERRIKGRWKVE